jgi:hypothetical protein
MTDLELIFSMLGEAATTEIARAERSGVPSIGAGSESGLSPAKRNAASFAAEFGCGTWGYLAGLRHDMRKYSTFYNK